MNLPAINLPCNGLIGCEFKIQFIYHTMNLPMTDLPLDEFTTGAIFLKATVVKPFTSQLK